MEKGPFGRFFPPSAQEYKTPSAKRLTDGIVFLFLLFLLYLFLLFLFFFFFSPKALTYCPKDTASIINYPLTVLHY